LLVEDNVLLCDVMMLALDSAGYVTTPSSGAAAPRLAQTLRPDVILLDLGLPDVDGAEVCRRLRADERTATIPIVAITGSILADYGHFDDVLTKPFSMQALLHKVRKWVSDPEARVATHAAS
jgi:two-component system cell cycle response regulator